MKKSATPKLIDLTREEMEEQIIQMEKNVQQAELQMKVSIAFDQGQISVLRTIADELPPTRLK